MSNSRVSNKQLLEAILALTAAMSKQAATPEPAVSIKRTETTQNDGIEVDAGYLANRKVAAQEHADTKGASVTLYARRNLKGETKLAYALSDRFATLKDRGLIGAIEVYEPQS